MLSDIDALEGLYARFFLLSTHTSELFDALGAAGQPWNGIRATASKKLTLTTWTKRAITGPSDKQHSKGQLINHPEVHHRSKLRALLEP